MRIHFQQIFGVTNKQNSLWKTVWLNQGAVIKVSMVQGTFCGGSFIWLVHEHLLKNIKEKNEMEKYI